MSRHHIDESAKKHIISISIDPSVLTTLKLIHLKEGISVSAQISEALKIWLIQTNRAGENYERKT